MGGTRVTRGHPYPCATWDTVRRGSHGWDRIWQACGLTSALQAAQWGEAGPGQAAPRVPGFCACVIPASGWRLSVRGSQPLPRQVWLLAPSPSVWSWPRPAWSFCPGDLWAPLSGLLGVGSCRRCRSVNSSFAFVCETDLLSAGFQCLEAAAPPVWRRFRREPAVVFVSVSASACRALPDSPFIAGCNWCDYHVRAAVFFRLLVLGFVELLGSLGLLFTKN